MQRGRVLEGINAVVALEDVLRSAVVMPPQIEERLMAVREVFVTELEEQKQAADRAAKRRREQSAWVRAKRAARRAMSVVDGLADDLIEAADDVAGLVVPS